MASSSEGQGARHVGRIVDPLVREDGVVEPELELDAEQAVSLMTDALPKSDAERVAQSEPPEEPASQKVASEQAALSAPTSSSPSASDRASATERSSTPDRVSTSEDSSTSNRVSASQGSSRSDPLSDSDGSSTSDLVSAANPPSGEPTPVPDSVSGAVRTGHPVRDRLLARARSSTRATPTSSAEPSETPARGLNELESQDFRHPFGSSLDQIAAGQGRPPSAPVLRRSRSQLSPNLVAVFGALMGLATVASLVALMTNFAPESPLRIFSSVPEPPPEAPSPTQPAPPKATPKPKRQKLKGPWRIEDAKDQPGLKLIEGKVGTQAFLRAVQDAGLEKAQAYRVLTALKPLKDLNHCDRSDKFRALVDRASSKVKAFEYIVSKEEVYQAKEGSDGLLNGARLDLKVKRAQVKSALVYNGTSFNASAGAAGLESDLARVLSTALEGHMNLEELERGDRLRIIAQEVTVLGEFSRYAGVEAVEVVRADSDTKRLRVYYFSHPQAGGYFDQRGHAPYEGGWRKPIKDAPITSPFNPRRMHPILKKIRPHNGIDFGAAAGTPIGASSYGTISFIGPAGPSGNLVKIDHPGGIETGYAHMSRFVAGLSVGDKVKRLQVVGYVGSTGRSTGPHLHFTAKKNGKFIDPASLNLDGMRVLPKEHRSAFETVKAKYDQLLDAIPLPPLPKAEPAKAVASADEALGSAADDRDDTSDFDPGASPVSAKPAKATPVSAKPAKAAAVGAKPVSAKPASAKPAQPKGHAAIFLTDKELLEVQSRSDDGEVSE